MTLKKNISNMDQKQLLEYLDSLHRNIEIERKLAIDAAEILLRGDLTNLDADTELVLAGKTAADFLKEAGAASSRMLKIAEIKMKLVLDGSKKTEEKPALLTEDDKKVIVNEVIEQQAE